MKGRDKRILLVTGSRAFAESPNGSSVEKNRELWATNNARKDLRTIFLKVSLFSDHARNAHDNARPLKRLVAHIRRRDLRRIRAPDVLRISASLSGSATSP